MRRRLRRLWRSLIGLCVECGDDACPTCYWHSGRFCHRCARTRAFYRSAVR